VKEEKSMAQTKKAAIDLDKLGEKKLADVSAADFLTALDAGGIELRHFTVWPEKKKVELWQEPENYGRISVKDIVIRIQVEKKKVELEKFPGGETWRDPRELTYDNLLDRLTRDIEARLRVGR
jgi:hypothetical protein